MTSAECEQCRMAVSDYYFISVPNMLKWADGVVNCMFCVKEDSDIPRAITTLIENNATKRAFLEVGLGAMTSTFQNNVPHWDEVFYVIEIHNHADVLSLLASDPKMLARTFLIEFCDFGSWDTNVQDDIKLVESAGLRTFAPTHDNPVTATYDEHMKIFNLGFDVVYTYNLNNAVEARVDINTDRGLTPP
jgi:hypothetical protein